MYLRTKNMAAGSKPAATKISLTGLLHLEYTMTAYGI